MKSRICVWAVDSSAYMTWRRNYDIDGWHYTFDRPGFGFSEYVHAQEGMFSFSPWAESMFMRHDDFRPMDESIVAAENDLGRSISKKITLPYSQCKDLIRRLSLEGITKGRLMPSHDKVAESLTDEWIWSAIPDV